MIAIKYPLPANEVLRLQALREYDLLDTRNEYEYESFVILAASICNVPVSLITLLDGESQFFKAAVGTDVPQTPREFSFCNYTILEPSRVTVIEDLSKDERFDDNPLVHGEEHVRFYAGAPLCAPGGNVLGSICVVDRKPRRITKEQSVALQRLAEQVVARFELKKKLAELDESRNHLRQSNQRLKQFAEIVSHDMKTPLANITLLCKSFQYKFQSNFTEDETDYLSLISRSALELGTFIDDMLVRSENIYKTPGNNKTDSEAVVKKVINLLSVGEDIELSFYGSFPFVAMDKTELQQVFQNLISNAIKYNDKPVAEVRVTALRQHNQFVFEIDDNGYGIAPENFQLIFENRTTLGEKDRFGNEGTGLGLCYVKNLVETAGGSISVRSRQGCGSTFSVKLPM